MNKDIRLESCYKVAPNIALIKYWGKFDTELILPLNSSISVTLSCDDLFTQTQLIFTNSASVSSDCLILNKKEDKITERIKKILNFFRNNTKQLIYQNDLIDENIIKQMHFIIKSENSFPTAAGLASSASGLACLVCCLQAIFNFKEEYPHQLSEIARLGSGSACRSLYGGIVEWIGVNKEILTLEKKLDLNELQQLSKQCIAKQIFKVDEIAKYEILVIVCDLNEKKIKSTFGMQQTVETSQLLQYRVRELVSEKINNLKSTLKDKKINETAKIIIQDSNQFHATCLDTMPPLFYLNELSFRIISFVHQFNDHSDFHIAYTFDAGPNAVLLIPSEIYLPFIQLFWDSFKIGQNFKKIKFIPEEKFEKLNNQFGKEEDNNQLQNIQNLPCMIIKTSIGNGPVQIY